MAILMIIGTPIVGILYGFMNDESITLKDEIDMIISFPKVMKKVKDAITTMFMKGE